MTQEKTKSGKLKKIISVCFAIIYALIIILSFYILFSTIITRKKNLPPTFFGYSLVQVVSGSMTNSGLNVGDNLAVRSVKTDTLKAGDIIAFYVYADTYDDVNEEDLTVVDNSNIELSYSYALNDLIGIRSDNVKQAGKLNCKLVIHHIREVLETEDGSRYFTTYGSSVEYFGTDHDDWLVPEEMVIGCLVNSGFASVVAKCVGALASNWAILLIILIPMVLYLFFIVLKYYINKYKIEITKYHILQGKISLEEADKKFKNIGFTFEETEKQQILLETSDENKEKTCSLLYEQKKEK